MGKLNFTPQLHDFGFELQGVTVTFFSVVAIIFPLCLPLHFLLPAGAKSRSARALQKAILVALPASLDPKKYQISEKRMYLQMLSPV